MGCGFTLIGLALGVPLVFYILGLFIDDPTWGMGYLFIFPFSLIAFYFGIVAIILSVKKWKSSEQIKEEKESIPFTYECEECGTEIAESDEICPKCGVEFEEE